jgi:hypothetical protein
MLAYTTATAAAVNVHRLFLPWSEAQGPHPHPKVFLFENKAPVDVQIQIHIEKLCLPRRSSWL